MANILFDLDGTIAKTTQYHKVGWELTLSELKLGKSIDSYLPYEKGLQERYDSYRRLKDGFLSSPDDIEILTTYFAEKDFDILTHLLLDLKESFTIKAILEGNPTPASQALGTNIEICVKTLKAQNHILGILSSSRKGIVCTFADRAEISKYFTYLMGEEDMTTSTGELLDKPNPFGASTIKAQVGTIPDYYIGDSKDIDPVFAEAIKAKFISYEYSSDANFIIDSIC